MLPSPNSRFKAWKNWKTPRMVPGCLLVMGGAFMPGSPRQMVAQGKFLGEAGGSENQWRYHKAVPSWRRLATWLGFMVIRAIVGSVKQSKATYKGAPPCRIGALEQCWELLTQQNWDRWPGRNGFGQPNNCGYQPTMGVLRRAISNHFCIFRTAQPNQLLLGSTVTGKAS